MIEKRCSKCKILQSTTDFHKDKRKSDGRNSICKTCRNKAAEQEKENEVKIPDSKCHCDRSESLIFKKDCVPGCNDTCETCKNSQTQNIKAGGIPLTPEEDRDMSYTSSFGNSGAMAAAEGFYQN